MPDIQLVGMANVAVPVVIAQKAAQAALGDSDEDCGDFTRELQARRDLLMQELAGLPVGVPAGGWSFILRVKNGKEATSALMEEGISPTPMAGWGEAHGECFVRFVFLRAVPSTEGHWCEGASCAQISCCRSGRHAVEMLSVQESTIGLPFRCTSDVADSPNII